MDVRNRLAEVRQRRGLSAAELASRAGVKRQTIYAIEAQRYIPNTMVALRLAKILEVSVEDMFSIAMPSPAAQESTPVDLLAGQAESGHAYQPVRLAKVGKRLIGVPSPPVFGELPAADAIITGRSRGGRALVRPIRDEADAKNRLIVAGCDPAMPVLARQVRKQGNIELIIAMCSSRQALEWLEERKIHIAGTHLSDKSAGGSNLEVIRSFFPRRDVRIVTFASWEEGLVVAAGNPKGILEVGDLARPEIAIINREVGSGARVLLDSSLKREGIPPGKIRGYGQTTGGHVVAAWHVHSGKADCCIATRAAARVFGLHFLPLACERYDLVIPEKCFDLPAVQVVLNALNRASFRGELETLGGYDTSQTGRLVS
jgi:molybdopterin molybdotransferase/putative molybdopterin biosynthesis protein